MRFLFAITNLILVAIGAPSESLARQTDADSATERRDRGASWAPDSRRVVVYSFRGGLPDLFILSLDGGERRLTDTAERWELEPDWAPDGLRIVFAAGSDMRSLGIFDMAADGEDERVLFMEPGTVNAPRYSRDGERIIFSYAAPGRHFAIFSMDRNGGDLREITQEPQVSILRPRYSPDGSAILVAARIPVPANNPASDTEPSRQSWGDLFLLTPDGEMFARLTDTPHARETFMSWSADGGLIFFSRGQEGEANDLYAMNADGSDLRRITHTPQQSEYFSRVSPDGLRLAFDTGDRVYWIPVNDLNATPVRFPD
ncbi:TolB family protein [Hyphobacterium sp.]|uniref:TolB family protein n=1 Tax=Hyphobacterium sp. TaxID=2004662 RepID=UPI003BADA11E